MNLYQEDHSEQSTIDSIRSARCVVPFVIDLIHPQSVIDVGCGLGGWLSVFNECGVNDILGIDGDYVETDRLNIPLSSFRAQNLTNSLDISGYFDLAVSLEVAEHLPSSFAKLFINSLTSLAPVVLFSAAVPGQPGTQHINCQWPEYWAHLFYQNNFVLFDCLRSKFWNNKGVDWWYSQNMFLFVNASYLDRYPSLAIFDYLSYLDSPPIAMIHPDLYSLNTQILCNRLCDMESRLNEALNNKTNPLKSFLKKSFSKFKILNH